MCNFLARCNNIKATNNSFNYNFPCPLNRWWEVLYEYYILLLLLFLYASFMRRKAGHMFARNRQWKVITLVYVMRIYERNSIEMYATIEVYNKSPCRSEPYTHSSVNSFSSLHSLLIAFIIIKKYCVWICVNK